MTGNPSFIPGLTLNREFFAEIVRPLLAAHYPQLHYAAGRLDHGSEVLGFDTPTSTDHDWGPRLQLFVAEKDEPLIPELRALFDTRIPPSFRGYATHFGEPSWHHVTLTTPERFFRNYLGCVPSPNVAPQQWLTLSEQKLATIRSGELCHDDLALDAYRALIRYYPEDVWLYLMASQWMKIGQEEPFVGRCHQVGDDLGARIIAARLVHTAMHMCFLLTRTYAPYSKWFGTGFANLPGISPVKQALSRAISTADQDERESSLCEAYELLAAMHNALGVTPPLDTATRPFYSRPFVVIDGGRFARTIQDVISDPDIRRLPLIGSVNQLSSTVDYLENDALLQRSRVFYEAHDDEY